MTALGIYAVVYSLRQTTSPARPELLYPRRYRLSTFFMVAGALLWLVPQVLAIETTSQPFFAPVVSVLTSTNHHDLATWILVGSVVLVALTGA